MSEQEPQLQQESSSSSSYPPLVDSGLTRASAIAEAQALDELAHMPLDHLLHAMGMGMDMRNVRELLQPATRGSLDVLSISESKSTAEESELVQETRRAAPTERVPNQAQEQALVNEHNIDPCSVDVAILEMDVGMPLRDGVPPDLVKMVYDNIGVPPVDQNRALALSVLRHSFSDTWPLDYTSRFYTLLYVSYVRRRTPMRFERWRRVADPATGGTKRELRVCEEQSDYDLLEHWRECKEDVVKLWHEVIVWWRAHQQQEFERKSIHKNLDEEEREFCGDDQLLREIVLFLRTNLQTANPSQFQRIWQLVRDGKIGPVALKNAWARHMRRHGALPEEPTPLIREMVWTAVRTNALDLPKLGLVALMVQSVRVSHMRQETCAAAFNAQEGSATIPLSILEEARKAADVAFAAAIRDLWKGLVQLFECHCECETLVRLMERCQMDPTGFIEYLVQHSTACMISDLRSVCLRFASQAAQQYGSAGKWRQIHNLHELVSRECYFRTAYTLSTLLYMRPMDRPGAPASQQKLSLVADRQEALERAMAIVSCLGRQKLFCERIAALYYAFCNEHPTDAIATAGHVCPEVLRALYSREHAAATDNSVMRKGGTRKPKRLTRRQGKELTDAERYVHSLSDDDALCARARILVYATMLLTREQLKEAMEMLDYKRLMEQYNEYMAPILKDARKEYEKEKEKEILATAGVTPASTPVQSEDGSLAEVSAPSPSVSQEEASDTRDQA